MKWGGGNRTVFYMYASIAFLWGWLYYLAMPIWFSGIYIKNGFPLYKTVQSLLLSMDLRAYWIFCLSLLVAFFSGILLSSLAPMKLGTGRAERGVSHWVILGVVVVQLFCYFQLRNSLFQGYGGLNWDEKNPYKSFISGLNVTLGVIFVLNYDLGGKRRWMSLIALLINSIMLLGMGGRMYVLIPIITFIYYKLVFGAWGIRKVLVMICLGAGGGLLVGLLRQGADVTVDGILYVFLGEPILNWIGGANFWVVNKVDLFEIPYGILGAILGMIPTFLWPSKAEYLGSFANNGFSVESPVGGTNVIISLLSNFGICGSVVAVLFLGIFTGILVSLSRKGQFFKCLLSAHVALLAFMFFRDNFGIHIKTLFVNALLIPYVASIPSYFRMRNMGLKS